MIPGRYDFSIYKGGTYKTKVVGEDNAGLTIDFTQYTDLRMQIRLPYQDSTEPLLELNLANGGISKVEANLALELYISAVDTAAFNWEVALYDLELIIVDAGNDTIIDKLLYGKITTVPEVTI